MFIAQPYLATDIACIVHTFFVGLNEETNRKMGNINVLTIRFKNHLYQSDVTKFRGAAIAATSEKNVLFHGHTEEGFRYSYPLIQYKSLRGKASIVCIDKGLDVIGELLNGESLILTMDGKKHDYQLDSIEQESIDVTTTEEEHSYEIKSWLAVNQDLLPDYKKLNSLSDRRSLLERVLTGNILSFAKGVGVFFDDKVKVSIKTLDAPKSYFFKGRQLIGFDAEFSTNVSLPSNIGLGKSSSIGFGVISKTI